ncbi:MAG: hypothetical protein H7267_03150, partial [Sandarakinorhabdus sp.]|nr:hypothetical protein [Sandarakinorhabdus sp.]
MKIALAFAVTTVSAIALAAPALASGWDGTWHGDIASYKPPSKIVTRLLKNGHYTSDGSVPPRDIVADGKFHAIKGDPYADEMMVQAVDKATVKQAMRKAGKDVSQSVSTVEASGKTLTMAYTDMTAPGGTVTGTNKSARVTAGPPG